MSQNVIWHHGTCIPNQTLLYKRLITWSETRVHTEKLGKCSVVPQQTLHIDDSGGGGGTKVLLC